MKHTGRANQQHKSAGDTIVEVLIAMMVISVVLVGAFVVANRSTRGVRDAEEHAQAMQYLQGQVELLRTAASHHGGLPSSLNTAFCLDSSGYYQPASGDPHCTVGSLYSLAIKLSPMPPVPNTTTFELTASWPGLRKQTDYVNFYYRVVVVP